LGKTTGTRLRCPARAAVSTAVLLGILVLAACANAQTGSTYYTFSPGVSLISVPFDYTSDDSTLQGDPWKVLRRPDGSQVWLDTVPAPPATTDFNFLTWLVGMYYEYPNLPANRFMVGKGYFVYTPTTSLSVFASDAVAALEISKPDPVAIELYPGWNLIGAPYHGTAAAYSVRWYGDAVTVQVGSAAPISMREANASLIIKSGLWSYMGWRYELSYSVDEWEGYWVKAYQNCRLLIGRQERGRSRMGSSNAAPPEVADIWSQRLVARAGSSANDAISFGLSSDATDGYDVFRDVEKPPAVTAGPYVYLSFPHPDWSANAGDYGVDVRSRGGRKVWKFTVTSSSQDSDIVMTWPGIGDLPKDVNLALVDEETGARRFMRTCSGYRFRLASGAAARGFRIEAVPAGAGVLRISGLSASGGRGGSRTISCSLSTGASVDVAIKSATGSRAVRRVASGATRAAGLNQFVWDCRDEGGAPTPAGVYLCEVHATGDDGQVAKAVAVLMVAR